MVDKRQRIHLIYHSRGLASARSLRSEWRIPSDFRIRVSRRIAIHPPIGNGLGKMGGSDLIGVSQIGDGAGYL